MKIGTAARLEKIANQTEGYSGAELVGVLRAATSLFAMGRCMDPTDWSKDANKSALEIGFADLEKGLEEMKDAKDVKESRLRVGVLATRRQPAQTWHNVKPLGLYSQS